MRTGIALFVAGWLVSAVPATPVPAGVDTCGRLSVGGRFIVCEDGTIFRWRGVTAFRLAHQVATGEAEAARTYLAWAAGAGFNLVRVLSTAEILFDLPPEAGRRALPGTFALARAHGLYVEVVAVVDSAVRDYDWRAHAREVAEICAAAANCVYEFANEPGHGVQHETLHDMRTVDALAREATEGLDLLWTAGPAWDRDTALTPTGSFAVRHLARLDEPWPMIVRVREFEALSAELGRPVVSNEPVGFDEADGRLTGRQRIDDCDVALAMGALARVFEVATTFHLEAGLLTEPPGPVQRACAGAFVRGTRLVGDDVRLWFQDAGWEQSPVASADTGRVLAVFSGVSGDAGLTVALGVSGDPGIVWGGYRPGGLLVDRPGLRIWRVEREGGGGGGSPWESNPPFPPQAGSDRF